MNSSSFVGDLFSPGHVLVRASVGALAIALLAIAAGQGLAELIPVNPAGSCVRFVAVDPNDGRTVYAVTYEYAHALFPGSTVYRSTDAGASWIEVGQTLPHTAMLEGLAVDSGSAVYTTSTGNNKVYRSVDRGSSWQAVGDYSTWALVAHPSIPGTLFGYGFGVQKSTDGGATWVQSGSGLGEALPGESGPSTSSFAIDSRNPSTIYVGRWEKGVYKSTDGGAHWKALDLGFEPSAVIALAVDPNNSSVVYAGTIEDGLLGSTDGGASWKSVNTGQPNPQFFALAFDRNSTLFAGVYDHGVLSSSDGGTTWTNVTPVMRSNYIVTLVADPATAGRVHVGVIQ